MDAETIGASVVATIISKMVFHPIDTLRTIKQTSMTHHHRITFKMLWNGFVPATSLAVPGFTAYLVAYRQTKAWLTPKLGANSMLNYVISGAAAELASSFIWTPMEVLKGRMQIAARSQRPRDVVKYIYKTEGIAGFFRGYWMGIAVFLPHSVVWWASYERAKAFYARKFTVKKERRPLIDGAAAATATTIAGVATNFLDVVKTRQQLAYSDEVGGLRPDDRQGVLKVARNLIREAGPVRALFKGLGVRLACAVPSSMLTMMIVEMIHPDPCTEVFGSSELDP